MTHADAEIVPKFRPEDNCSNVTSWLQKIDQLVDVYGWDTKRGTARCNICQRAGHTSCWFAATPGTSQQQAPQVSHIMYTTTKNLSIYKRVAYSSTEKLTTYIDTGSKLNIITQNKVKCLELAISPSAVVMMGFGGAHTRSLGRTRIDLYIDNVFKWLRRNNGLRSIRYRFDHWAADD